MNTKWNRSRRQFLRDAALSFAAMNAAGMLTRTKSAQAGTNYSKQRYIRIEAPGGWDNYRFTEGLLKAKIRGFASDAELNGVYDQRYSDSEAVESTHTPGAYVGNALGNPNVFPTSVLNENLCIWRGLQPAGSHTIGNAIINKGAFSSYAASSCSLFAVHFGEGQFSPRDLHYVQIANNFDALNSGPGLLKGLATPVRLSSSSGYDWKKNLSTGGPDWVNHTGAWTAVTNPVASEPTDTRRDAITKAVNNITSAVAGRLMLDSSKIAYSNFNVYYASSESLLKTHHSKSTEFIAACQRYYDLLSIKIFGGSGVAMRTPSLKDWIDGTHFNTQGSQVFNEIGVAGKNWDLIARELSFRFALAEFLIVYNLSTVVEIEAINSDAHDYNDDQLAQLLMTFSCYGELVRFLKAPTYGVDQTNYLDRTTISLSCEFNRTSKMSNNSGRAAPREGTNHGATTTFVVVGPGFKPGIWGEFKNSAGGTEQTDAGGFKSFGFEAPLPIDVSTGKPSESGTILTTKWIFPTVLAAWKIPVPPVQLTDGHDAAFLRTNKDV